MKFVSHGVNLQLWLLEFMVKLCNFSGKRTRETLKHLENAKLSIKSLNLLSKSSPIQEALTTKQLKVLQLAVLTVSPQSLVQFLYEFS